MLIVVFDMVKNIKDPEYPYTLQQLGIVSVDDIRIEKRVLTLEFKPTIMNCTMAVFIGLALIAKLNLCVPKQYICRVKIKSGTHNDEANLNKQFCDKERSESASYKDGIKERIKAMIVDSE